MKPIIFKLVGVYLCSLAFIGCTSLDKPFFYEIKKGNKQAYMLGTLHRGVPYTQVPEYIYEKLDAANTVLIETDTIPEDLILDTDYQKLEQKRLTFAMLKQPGEQDLQKLISNKAWKYVKRNNLMLTDEKLNNLTPYGAYLLSKERKKFYVDRDTYQQLNSAWSMDRYIHKRAVENKKMVYALDVDGYYDSLEHRACVIIDGVQSIETLAEGAPKSHPVEDILKLVELYKSGSEQAMIQALNSQETKQQDKCLLDDRNKLWMPIIERVVENEGPTFIAVGLAHVIYRKYNLIDLLKQKGYTVRRIQK